MMTTETHETHETLLAPVRHLFKTPALDEDRYLKLWEPYFVYGPKVRVRVKLSALLTTQSRWLNGRDYSNNFLLPVEPVSGLRDGAAHDVELVLGAPVLQYLPGERLALMSVSTIPKAWKARDAGPPRYWLVSQPGPGGAVKLRFGSSFSAPEQLAAARALAAAHPELQILAWEPQLFAPPPIAPSETTGMIVVDVAVKASGEVALDVDEIVRATHATYDSLFLEAKLYGRRFWEVAEHGLGLL